MGKLLTLVLLMGVGGTMLEGQFPATTARFDVIGTKFVGAYVGTHTHCFFWSLDPPNPWRVEAACYSGTIEDLQSIYVIKKDNILVGTFNSDEGSISWFFFPTITVPTAAASPLMQYQISINHGTTTELVRLNSF